MSIVGVLALIAIVIVNAGILLAWRRNLQIEDDNERDGWVI